MQLANVQAGTAFNLRNNSDDGVFATIRGVFAQDKPDDTFVGVNGFGLADAWSTALEV